MVKRSTSLLIASVLVSSAGLGVAFGLAGGLPPRPDDQVLRPSIVVEREDAQPGPAEPGVADQDAAGFLLPPDGEWSAALEQAEAERIAVERVAAEQAEAERVDVERASAERRTKAESTKKAAPKPVYREDDHDDGDDDDD